MEFRKVFTALERTKGRLLWLNTEIGHVPARAGIRGRLWQKSVCDTRRLLLLGLKINVAAIDVAAVDVAPVHRTAITAAEMAVVEVTTDVTFIVIRVFAVETSTSVTWRSSPCPPSP